jgi:hypothetical protein
MAKTRSTATICQLGVEPLGQSPSEHDLPLENKPWCLLFLEKLYVPTGARLKGRESGPEIPQEDLFKDSALWLIPVTLGRVNCA